MKDVNLLKQALPYIRKYKGKVFVIKMGGQVARNKEHLENLAEDISLLHQVGIKVVVIHGGGPQATELSDKLGHKTEMINGRRVTTDEVLEVAKMVYAGKINVEILSALLRHGTMAVGVSGVDGGLIKAKRRKPVMVEDGDTGDKQLVDYGHVGDIQEINGNVLRTLLDNDYVPVVSSLGGDDEGNIPKIFIYGANIVAFSVAEKEISLEGLAKELEKQFPPGGIQFFQDRQIIVVMNKIRISSDGVDGHGPLYERVYQVAEPWLRDRGLIE